MNGGSRDPWRHRTTEKGVSASGSMVVAEKKTYERESVRIWVHPDVSRKVSVRHPIRNEFERVHVYTQEWNNVWMFQVFRLDGDLTEDLWYL